MPLSFTGAQWSPLSADPEHVRALEAHGLSSVSARCAALRFGERAPDLLRPASIDQLHDPSEMHNMDAAVDRLRKAIFDKQHVRIITDYDVDGTTSSLILQAALRLLDRDVRLDYHIPNRFGEGYGFSPVAAKKAGEEGVGLIVTADIGVRDHAAVELARNRDMDVLICDHHLPAGADVPSDALVLCPPQRACSYPNRSLAACGVSLKLAQALLGQHPRWHEILLSLLKLAAVGTVADLVPLTTVENRAIVALGLEQLNKGPHHPGLDALLKVCNLEPGTIRESHLGFRIGPRINAAGRIDDAKLVVRLLNCRNPVQAQALAQHLDSLNTHRRDIQRRVEEQALERIGDDPAPFLVVAGSEEDGWHRGVVGIVASRLKDVFHRPVAVVSIQGELAVGSVRSVPGVHAVKALDTCADLLVKYGGHPAAAGFTIATEHLPTLRERLTAAVDAAQVELIPEHDVDAEVSSTELTEQTFAEIARLGPFGMGNPRPRLLVKGVKPIGVRQLGKEGAMLKFLIPREGGGLIEAIWWGNGERADAFRAGPVDLLGKLGENFWNGRRTLQLDLVDARPAEDDASIEAPATIDDEPSAPL